MRLIQQGPLFAIVAGGEYSAFNTQDAAKETRDVRYQHFILPALISLRIEPSEGEIENIHSLIEGRAHPATQGRRTR